MENKDFVEHQGRVTSINTAKGTLTVTFIEDADCGGCPASKLCANFSPDKNTMEIPVDSISEYKVGDFVVVEAAERLHRKAIIIVTVIPSFALIAVMIGIYLLTHSQLAACLSGLGAMAAFFIGLFLIRKKLAREFVFNIRKAHRAEEGENE